MATIQKFEDIEAWQKARELTQLIYSLTSGKEFTDDYGLRNQIRRASVSAMSNIAEGFSRAGNKEFTQYLYIARSSVAEVKSQAYVLLDSSQIDQSIFDDFYKLASETEFIITGFIRYLSKTDLKGKKFS